MKRYRVVGDEGVNERVRTVLHAVRAPLVLRDLAEDDRAVIKQLIHDSIFRFGFKILKGVLVRRGAITRVGPEAKRSRKKNNG